MKDYTKIIIGGILVLLGLSILFDQLGINTWLGISLGNIFTLFWPLIIVAIGLSVWLNNKNNGGIIIIVVGLFFLGNSLFSFNFFTMFWPLLLIVLGILILFKGSSPKVSKATSKEDAVAITSIFTGVEKRVESEKFEGGSVLALFGGVTLDLTQAKIDKDGATVELTAVFGGITVKVPENVKVRCEGSAMFGGWDDKTKNTKGTTTLTLTGLALFGGIEAK